MLIVFDYHIHIHIHVYAYACGTWHTACDTRRQMAAGRSRPSVSSGPHNHAQFA